MRGLYASATALATDVACSFVAQDLFCGRMVYLDGERNRVFTPHSLLLCLFFGPLGILSHVLTRWGTGLARGEALPAVGVVSEPAAE